MVHSIYTRPRGEEFNKPWIKVSDASQWTKEVEVHTFDSDGDQTIVFLTPQQLDDLIVTLQYVQLQIASDDEL